MAMASSAARTSLQGCFPTTLELPGDEPIVEIDAVKPEVIRYAVWLYFRFTLGLRDVEELLAERGIPFSYDHRRARLIQGRSA